MAGIKLDLTQFHHVKSDKDTTTLQHRKGGHQLTLMHKTLSPENQEQLAALAKLSQQSQTPEQTAEVDQQKMSEGGLAKYKDRVDGSDKISESKKLPPKYKLAKGGPVEQETMDYSPSDSPGMCYACGGPVDHPHRKMYASGSDQVVSDEDLAPGQPAQQEPKVIGTNIQSSIPSYQISSPRSEDPELVRKQQAAMKAQDVADTQLNAAKNNYNQMLKSANMPTSADDMFGPNGEPPKNPVNPNLWAQANNTNDVQDAALAQLAKQKSLLQSDDIIQQQQAQHEDAQSQNAINAQIGKPQMALDPGAPQINPKDQQAAGEVNPDDMYSSYQNALNVGLKGTQERAVAESQIAQQTASREQTAMDANQSAQLAYRNSVQELNGERQDLMHDIQNNMVDPEQYWHNHSKLMSGIGMIIAGFNPTSNPNAAINFIKSQIENNINAQSQNLNARNNLLAHNIQQFQNLNIAANMTRLQMADYAAFAIDQAKQNSGSQMAQANADLAKSQLYQQYAPLMMRASIFRTLQKLQSSPNGGMKAGQSPTAAIEATLPQMRLVAPDIAKQVEDHMIPGVGANATQVVPQEIRDRAVAMKNLHDRISDLQQFIAKNPPGAMLPGSAAWQQGTQKAAEIGALYSQSLGGSMTEGRISWLDKQIAEHPTGLPAYLLHNASKLNEIKDANLVRMGNTLKSVGLPMPQSMQSTSPDNSLQNIINVAQKRLQQNPKDTVAQEALRRAKLKLGSQ